jgi:hypothetical protein
VSEAKRLKALGDENRKPSRERAFVCTAPSIFARRVDGIDSITDGH